MDSQRNYRKNGTEETSGSRPKLITIVWAPHEERTATFAKRLKSPLFNIHYLLYKRPFIAPLKYIAQWFKTWLVLFQQRPNIVYITNPPPVAALCVAVYGMVSRTPFIMDTHSPTLFNKKWGWSVPLQRVLARRAYINIVDQTRFKNLMESWNARAIVLENPPKNIDTDRLKGKSSDGYFDITVVTIFASDEPIDIIVEAAKQLPDFRFYILGDKARAKRSMVDNAPENVIFTGYLHKDDYWNRLNSSNAVMTLTTHAYSLLAGGQDGVAVNKPLMLSKQPTLTAYFTKGTVFVENTVEGILEGVRQAKANEPRLIQEVIELGREQAKHWESNFQELLALIDATKKP